MELSVDVRSRINKGDGRGMEFVLTTYTQHHDVPEVIFTLFPSPEPFQWSSLSDDTVDNNQHTRQRGTELKDKYLPLRAASSRSLADLLALYIEEGRQQPLSDPAPLEKKLSTVLNEQDGNPSTADWPIPSKKKRNFSLGVAGMCCNQGCTKNDIGRLC